MKLFVDFDDTMVRSSESVINILNSKFGLNKKLSDLRDWCYCSIYKKSNADVVGAIYNSEELFEDLKFFDGCLDILRGKDVTICSCGHPENIEKKKKFIKSNCPTFNFVYIDTSSGKTGKDKSEFDMVGAIQIDDRYDNLKNTNAKIKILFKNFNDFEWQRIESNSDVYVVNTWEEIKQIIDWCDVNDD